MQVILKQDVNKLGEKDELVSVKPGYGRNYLIPKGYAILATASVIKMHEETLRQRSHKATKVLEEAQKLADKLKDTVLKVGAKVGENGKIFGSVNTIQLADELKKQGHEIDRKNIAIKGDAIKSVGTYEAELKLHKEISQTIKFEVVEE
jgi:large subunit ribosomal protein L9